MRELTPETKTGMWIGAVVTTLLWAVILGLIIPATPNYIWHADAIEQDCGWHDPRTGSFILGPYPFKDQDAKYKVPQAYPPLKPKAPVPFEMP